MTPTFFSPMPPRTLPSVDTRIISPDQEAIDALCPSQSLDRRVDTAFSKIVDGRLNSPPACSDTETNSFGRSVSTASVDSYGIDDRELNSPPACFDQGAIEALCPSQSLDRRVDTAFSKIVDGRLNSPRACFDQGAIDALCPSQSLDRRVDTASSGIADRGLNSPPACSDTETNSLGRSVGWKTLLEEVRVFPVVKDLLASKVYARDPVYDSAGNVMGFLVRTEPVSHR